MSCGFVITNLRSLRSEQAIRVDLGFLIMALARGLGWFFGRVYEQGIHYVRVVRQYHALFAASLL